MHTLIHNDTPLVNATELAPSTGKRKIRVLHVDDEHCLLEVSKQILALDNDFEIDVATSVDEAFKKLATETYDAIISDHEMPQKDGLLFLKELREQKNEIPFVLFTGKGREELAVKALNLGADAYINKQGDTETVYGELSHAIARAIDRKASKKLLVESESKYRKLVEDSQEGIAINIGPPPKFVFANSSMGKILGYSPEELVALSPEEIFKTIHPDDRKTFFSRFKKRMDGQEIEPFYKFRAIRKDGSVRWVEVHSNRIEYNGRLSLQGIFSDITERKNAEEALALSETTFKAYLESSPVAIFVANSSGKYEYVNCKATELLGYSRKELLNMTVQQVVPKEDAPIRSKFGMLKELGYFVEEMKLKRKNNTIIDVFLTASKLPDGKLVAFCEDITERKKEHQRLIDSEDKFRQAFAIGPDAFLISTLTGAEIVDVNERFSEMFGYSKQEVIGKSALLLGLWANPSDRTSIALQLKSEGKVKNREIFCKRKNGETFPVILSVSLLQSKNQTLALSVVRDVSSFKQAEDALRASEARYRMLTDNTRDVIWTMNLDGHFTYVSPSVFQLRGYTADEVMQQSMMEALTPDSAQRVLEGMQKFWENGTLNSSYYELEQPCKDGSTIWTEVNFTILRDENGNPESILGVSRDITESRKTKDEFKTAANIFDLVTDSIFVHDLDGNIVFFNEAACKSLGYSKPEMSKLNIKDLDAPESAKLIKSRINEVFEKGDGVFDSVQMCKDKTLMQVEIHARLISHEGKKLILSVARDVTDRKEAEEALDHAIEKIVLVNEKLNVVGKLTRHDVRNKLCIVTGNTYLIKKKLANKPDIVEGLNKVEQAVKDSMKIFEFAKTYEQLGVEEPKYVDVENTVDEAVALFSGLNFKVVNDCHGLSLFADSLLRQIFYNFIDNTRKYGKKTTIIRVYYEKAESGELRLIYEDDGVGISMENKVKLFKEGFSTGGSTGYGLFLSKKMIDVYGWQIRETGETGQGVKLVIEIPFLSSSEKRNYLLSNQSSVINRLCHPPNLDPNRGSMLKR